MTASPSSNQPLPLEDVSLFASDAALMEAVTREGGAGARPALEAFGTLAGSAEALAQGRLANENPPRLRTHDAGGRRLDRVEFHPAYHALLRIGCEAGLHCSTWSHLAEAGAAPEPGAHVARAATLYMATQMEAGHCCPLTMTNAAAASLAREPALARQWLPKLLARAYDPALAPLDAKAAVTIGMGLTERQGGTDVRANTTAASPASASKGPGAEYVLRGHKWFLSAPMSDAFLITAQAEGGLSAFLVPRILPGGAANPLHLVRLKDKLGNRSNATAEVELDGAHGWMIGEEGRGIPALMEMITYTRLDCAIASAGLMRRALAEAIHHAGQRLVFGRPLVKEPLMAHVLADLALEVEAATALVFRLARAFDLATDPRASAWRRIMTPVTKYWVTKLAPLVAAEAMECVGGSGYVEELGLACIYREAPVNAIWEGSGNVMALDVLRALQHEPEVIAMVMDELAASAAADPRLMAEHTRIEQMLGEPRLLEQRARMLVEGLATLAAATILTAHSDPRVADAFIASRLGHVSRRTYGQGLEQKNCEALVRRASPSRE